MDWIASFSGRAELINSQVIPWVLALVMAGLGLSLTAGDFRRVIVYPKAAAIGLVAQLIGLPLAAIGLSLLFDAPPEIAIGLIILAICPSGVTSNAYTFAARGDVPLAVTLSALTSVITVFSIPFLIGLALAYFSYGGEPVTISAATMLQRLATITLLPLCAGMIVRHFFSGWAEKAVEPIRKGVLYLMIGVLILGVVSSIEEIAANFATAGLIVIVMNVATMGLGFAAAKAFRLPIEQVVTITFEVGVQNLALALAITFNILSRPELAVAALIYAAVMPATALAFVSVGQRMIERTRGTDTLK